MSYHLEGDLLEVCTCKICAHAGSAKFPTVMGPASR